MNQPAVNVSHLSKTIGGRAILTDITFTLEKGSVSGFYGHNGSGKSMLFRAIAGLIKPSEGEIRVFGQKLGEEISFPPSIGLIIENVGFWPYYSGFENLKILASFRRQLSEDQIKENMRRVGLDPEERLSYSKYSLGMKQKLGIAQAVMEKPNLLLLDEPTNALDDDGVKRIYTIIREEAERGATILIASHNTEDLEHLCTRFFIMNSGRLEETEGIKGREV